MNKVLKIASITVTILAFGQVAHALDATPSPTLTTTTDAAISPTATPAPTTPVVPNGMTAFDPNSNIQGDDDSQAVDEQSSDEDQQAIDQSSSDDSEESDD